MLTRPCLVLSCGAELLLLDLESGKKNDEEETVSQSCSEICSYACLLLKNLAHLA